MPKKNQPFPSDEEDRLGEDDETIPELMEDEDESWMESLENLRDAELDEADDNDF